MRTLTRKLFRELLRSKAQAVAIGLVVASGVAVFVMALGTWNFLRETRDAYYDRYRFADVFASVARTPRSRIEQIRQIDGVATVQTRVAAEVTLDVPGLAEPAVGRLISIPHAGEPALNAVYLQEGRLPDPDRHGEVLASVAFVESNSLEIGDTVPAVMNGRLQDLRIVGMALSPEYVFQVRGGSLLPDDRRYGVFWMPRRQLEAAFDMEGAFNDVALALLRGASEEEVIDQLDAVLESAGGVGAYGREHQISARFLADEIRQLRGTAIIAPAIFLGVAAFLLNVVLSRRISTQRVVIAGLKAFGYSNRQIAWHYLQSSLIIAIGGATVGAVAGNWMGVGLARLYSEFYRFPTFVFRPDARVLLLAFGISVAAAAVGSFRAVQFAVRLPPAEAMRPAAPATYRRSLLERMGLAMLVPLTLRMIMRGLQRRPFNAMLSIIGISSAVAVLVMSGFGGDSIDYLIDFQFTRSQRHDVQVAFNETTSPAARFDLRHLPGVQQVEPFRAVSVRFVSAHRQHRTSIMGLPADRDLFRLLDADEKPILLPPNGLVLGDKLAEILHVRVGDTLTVEILEGDRSVREAIISGIAQEFSGTNAYMARDALHRLMRESDVLSGAFLAVDASTQDQLYQDLKRTPQVASVSVKSAAVQQFRDTIAKNQLTMQSFTVFFAGVIAIGVVYNTARVSLDERSRELATLRVIGFTQGEISSILLGELGLLTVVAIPLGWIVGYAFCAAMVRGFESELYRFPMVIQPASYARAALVTAAAAAASGLLVHRRLRGLDLVEVLKSRE